MEALDGAEERKRPQDASWAVYGRKGANWAVGRGQRAKGSPQALRMLRIAGVLIAGGAEFVRLSASESEIVRLRDKLGRRAVNVNMRVKSTA